jgi:5'-nucleotidase/UDP-sugar diphosphatase
MLSNARLTRAGTAVGSNHLKFRRFFLCLILLVFAGSAFSADGPKYLGITFLTTNDLHGFLLPFDVKGDPTKNIPDIKNVGGAARRATMIRTLRSEARDPVFLIDCGDTTHGWSPLTKKYHGEADIAVMNLIGYDAMVPGNHEFQWHAADPVRNIRDSKFPWVCANLVEEKTGETYLVPYIIREAQGVRVAFFGLINDLPSTQPKTYVAGPELGLKVLPPKEVAAKLVPALRKQADIVVLLSHLGTGLDGQIAKEIPGIDVILGGHSHSFLSTPRMAQTGQPSAFDLAAVPIVQAGYFGRKMGLTRLIFRRPPEADGRYTLMNCRGTLLDVNNSIADDPETARVIQDYLKRIPPPAPAK